MVEELFATLAAGLGLWKSKEARKYVDKLMKLQKDWYYEYNKSIPDDAVLDNLQFELRILSQAFSSQARAENPENKSEGSGL